MNDEINALATRTTSPAYIEPQATPHLPSPSEPKHEEVKTRAPTVVLEQTMSYLRECHGHLMTLTGRVVALNLAGLAAYGYLIQIESSSLHFLFSIPYWMLVAFAFLVMYFGIVFNWGAYKSQQHLLETELHLKTFINSQVDDEIRLNKSYAWVMNNDTENDAKEKEDVAKLTKYFLSICSIIWVLLGMSLLVLGFRTKFPSL